MRRTLLVCLMALTVLFVFAAPALALRDPFEPVISMTDEPAVTPETETPGETDGVTAPVITENGSEGLANTGADTEPWLVAAYALIAAGAAALALGKTLAPQS